jgi:hypothetical protein
MRYFYFVIFICLVGCAQEQQLAPTIRESRHVESRVLPVDPAFVALPEGFSTEDWVEPLEAASCVEEGAIVGGIQCPSRSGIVVSEARAWRDAQYRIGYQELRRLYEADRQVWQSQRELYEVQIQMDRQELERSRPRWWDRNKGLVLLGVGLIIGAGFVVGMTAILSEVLHSVL